MFSYLKELYYFITIKNNLNNGCWFMRMKISNLGRTPNFIKKYPQIRVLVDINYELDDELLTNTNIISCGIYSEYTCNNIYKIANMQWLISFYGAKTDTLIDKINMIILRFDSDLIIVPDYIQNINMILQGCLYYPFNTRIIYSPNVKKIRIVLSSAEELNRMFKLLDNLPV